MNTDLNNSMFNEVLSVIEGLREDPGNQNQIEKEPGNEKKLLSAIKEKIAHEAKKRNFDLAEHYRKKLANIAPDLLEDLYETGRIIAEEKRKANRKYPVSVNVKGTYTRVENHWARLENHFSDEEYTALLNILTPVHIDKLTELVEPNQLNNRLFLIHMGSVHIYYKAKGQKFVLKKLGAGSVCGAETFIYGNVSNTFIEASKGTRVDCLEKTKLNSLADAYPGIENRLINYINHCENDIDDSQINDTGIEPFEIIDAKESKIKKRTTATKGRPQPNTPPVNQNHWTNLENIFTKEEYAAFLSLMTPVAVDTLTPLVESDQMNDRLFFIHQGNVHIFLKANGQKNTIKKLGAVSICGVDTFISGSASNAFIEADTGARIDYVEKQQLASVAAAYPAIEDRLINYVYQCENDSDNSQQSNLDKASNRAGSIRVEKEKAIANPTVIQSHWTNLENYLSKKEHIAFIKQLTPVFFEKPTILVEPGRMNDKLFFIQQGSVNIYTRVNGKKIIIKQLGPGSICGVDTYTYGDVSNTYIEATPGTHIDYIGKVKLSRLIALFPAIENRLIRCIFDCDNDIDYSQNSGMDRRSYKRFTTFGIIDAQVIEPGEEPGTVISGRLIDISRRGLAFQIKTSHTNPEMAFKGKKANVVMEFEQMTPATEFFWGGAIVGVTALNELRYSIHLHGDKNSVSIAPLLRQFYEADKK